jgi:hypothetical protein
MAESLSLTTGFKKSRNFYYSLPLLTFISLLCIVIFLPFNGLYGQDGYEYYQYAAGLKKYMLSGIKPADIFHPMFYSLTGALLSLSGLNITICLQLVSMLSLCLGFFYLTSILRLLNEKSKYITQYALVFYILSPYLLRFSLLIMSDMLAMFFCMAAVYHILNYKKRSATIDFILSSIFIFSAILTRTPTAGLLLIPACLLLYLAITRSDIKSISVSALFVFILLAPEYLLRGRLLFFNGNDGVYLKYLDSFPVWSFSNLFASRFNSVNGFQSYSLPNIIADLALFYHPAYCFAAPLLLIFARRVQFRGIYLIIFISILFYSFFLAGFDSQNKRFLVIAVPLTLIWLYPAFEKATTYTKNKKQYYYLISSIIVAQLILAASTFNKVYRLNLSDRQLTSEVAYYPNKTVYTFGLDGALRYYGTNNKIISLWGATLHKVEPDALVLLNLEQLNTQFNESLPGINLRFIKNHSELTELHHWSSGWILFKTAVKDDK